MGKTVFEDGNIQTRVPGTRLLAAWLNKVFRHRHDGRDQDGSAPLDYAADTGPVNAVTAALPLPLGEHVAGMPINIMIAHTNTDAVTVTVDGLGPHPLHKLGGVELSAGDLQQGQIVPIAWDGVNWQLLSYNSPPVTDASTLQGQTAAQLAPPGAKGEFFMPTMPPGWLPCDGRAVLRAQYPALFAAIGTFWGAGDNVSTFNLPEVRGEFFKAWDNGRGVDPDRQFGSWQPDSIKAHRHPVYTSTLDGGDEGDSAGYGLSKSFENPDIPGGVAQLQESAMGSVGGATTQPRNIALFVGIKY